jgi:hypothetical protein
VYFYAIVGVAASMAFFASPAKVYLRKTLEKRNRPYLQRTVSQETMHPPSLGLPNDPGREIDDAIEEIRGEIQARQRRGSKVTMPQGQSLKSMVEEKMGRKLEMPDWKLPQVFGGDTATATGRNVSAAGDGLKSGINEAVGMVDAGTKKVR